jgi:hypothetical protein
VTRAAAIGAVLAAAVVLQVTAAADTSAKPARTPPEAPAAPKKKIIGILDVRVDGVSSTAAGKFETSIEDGLGSTEYWVATRKRMREILAGSGWSEGCTVGPCLLEVKRQTGADLVVDAYFQGSGSSYRFVVTLVDTASGAVTAQVADHCDVCTLTEALDSAALATIGLVHGAEGTEALTAAHATAPSPTPPPSPVRPLRRTAMLLIAAAVIAGGSAAYFAHTGDNKLGYAAGGAAGGLGVAGIAVLAVSFEF